MRFVWGWLLSESGALLGPSVSSDLIFREARLQGGHSCRHSFSRRAGTGHSVVCTVTAFDVDVCAIVSVPQRDLALL